MVVASQLRIQRRIILVERYSQSLSVHDIGLGASRFLRRGECQKQVLLGLMGRGPRLLGGWAPVYKRHKTRVAGYGTNY